MTDASPPPRFPGPILRAVMQPKLVVLDLAGTTIVDGGEVPAAFRAALAEGGIGLSEAQVAAVRGSSKREAILRLLPRGKDREQRAASIYANFCRHLRRLYESRGIRAVDGAEQLLGELRRRGIRVALNTGFDRAITDLVLGRLGWNDGLVDAVVCGDDVVHGRPSPDLILRAMELSSVPHAPLVASVGDTELDLHAGYNAGVGWNVGVLSGAHDRTRLEHAPHTHIIESIAELDDVWATG